MIHKDKHNRLKSFSFYFNAIVIWTKTVKGDVKCHGQDF